MVGDIVGTATFRFADGEDHHCGDADVTALLFCGCEYINDTLFPCEAHA